MTQAEQLAAQAAQWQAAGRPDMAAQLYATALDQDPTKFAIRMQLAECLVYLQQPDQAAEQYLMVAQAYAARGRQQECLALCERIIHIAPQAFVYMSVGPMVRRIGRHARPLCAKAAEIHLSSGRQTDGLQILRLGAELDPHNPEVRRLLARIYLARHMNREAVEALSDAANLLAQARRNKEYVEVAKQILSIQPNDLNTLRELPRVYLELGKPHEAVRTLGELTKVSPGDIGGYEVLAQAFAVIGRADKALLVLGRLVEQLGATGQADKADAILNHARYWRPTDLGFLRSLKAIEIPRPTPARASAPPPPSREGTVVLDISDLVLDEGSKRAPRPGREDSSVRLMEAEGTLTINLDELILDDTPFAETKPPPRRAKGSGPPPPPSKAAVPGPDPATVSLDTGDLMAALRAAGEATHTQSERPTLSDMPVIGNEVAPAATTSMPPTIASPSTSPPITSPPTTTFQRPREPAPLARHVVAGESPTIPAPASAKPVAAGHAISELIYDDADDDDGEPATELHMKAITAEDIARAQQRLAQATPVPAAPARASAGVDLDAPTLAPGARKAATPADDLDGPTLGPPPPRPAPRGMGDEAPTMARLTPLTAADIARALARKASAASTGDDEATLPPTLRRDAPRVAPEQPPLLAPGAPARPSDDDEDLTMVRMDALSPEDIERALQRRKHRDGDD